MALSRKRSILITGCSQGGAGHALALEFASQGMRVFATARSAKSIAGLEEKGVEILTLDVTSAESIAALKTEITNRTGGRLDMLFNNAGSTYEIPAIEANPNATRRMFDANVFGVFDMVSAFAPLLLAAVSDSRHPPTIINTSSIVSRVPYPFSAAYNASKAAISSYSDTLRVELGLLGIKVVTLFMGQVSTGITSPSSVEFGPNSLYTAAEEGVRARSREHLQNSMTPDEFARQVVNEVLHKKSGLGKGEYIWKGTSASTIWLLNAIGWRKIFDGPMEKVVSLTTDVKNSIFEKGQNSVKS